MQSTLGHTALTFGLIHVVLYASSYHECVFCKDWGTFEFWPNKTAPPSWVSVGLPGLTLLLRGALNLPGISHYLAKVRAD